MSQSAFDLLHPAWHHRAACSGQTELMYSLDRAEQARARLLCKACPIRKACLASALNRDEPEGIWGGFDPNERQMIQRRAPQRRFAL